MAADDISKAKRNYKIGQKAGQEPTKTSDFVYGHVQVFRQESHHGEHDETGKDTGGQVQTHQQQAISATHPEQGQKKSKLSE